MGQRKRPLEHRFPLPYGYHRPSRCTTNRGLAVQPWAYLIVDQHDRVVDWGEKWLISGLTSELAASYIANWWASQGGVRPGPGWRALTRPAWRTRQRGGNAVISARR